MIARLRSYRRACGKPMPGEARALACGCNGTSETFPNEAGNPPREGRNPVAFRRLGGCQTASSALLGPVSYIYTFSYYTSCTTFSTPFLFQSWYHRVSSYPVQQGSPSLRGKYPSRRGESGVGWLGGPLWSPVVPLEDADPATNASLLRNYNKEMKHPRSGRRRSRP